jgi:hypothetical protein
MNLGHAFNNEIGMNPLWMGVFEYLYIMDMHNTTLNSQLYMEEPKVLVFA